MTRVILGFSLLLLALLLAVKLIYGGGKQFPDRNAPPVAQAPALEPLLSYPEPIGSLAADDDESLFFAVHPGARPIGNKLLRWRDGVAMPFPDRASQQQRFNAIAAITLDRQNRLWVIDHGLLGRSPPVVYAFDASDGTLRYEIALDSSIVPFGATLQSIAVSADGTHAFIADSSWLRKNPALIVLDVAAASATRILEDHPALSSQGWQPRNADGALQLFGGLVSVLPGVDALHLSDDGDWLYLSAMSHDGLYRVPANEVREGVETGIERYSDKPLNSDLLPKDGRIYLTDVEHNRLMVVDARRRLRTLLSSDTLRWPSALAAGDEWIYVADSALPSSLLKPADTIESLAPFGIYRIRL